MFMKKSVFFLVLVLVLFVSSQAIAATEKLESPSGSAATTTIIGGGNFQVSTNVVLNFISTSAAYDAISYHLQGSREFGTNQASPKIFYKDVAQADLPASTVSAGFDFSAWK